MALVRDMYEGNRHALICLCILGIFAKECRHFIDEKSRNHSLRNAKIHHW
jgi:hypothetical protein